MKYVVFDMDGVIIDSEPTYLKRLMTFFEYKGFNKPLSFFYKTCGSNSRDCFEMYKKEIPNFYENNEEFRKEYNEFHKESTVDYAKIVDEEIYSLLSDIKKKNKIIILASSSPMKYIHKILNEIKIIDYFDLIVSGEDFDRSKPDPAIYNFIKNRYNASEEEFIVIEDSEYGIKAAKGAGMKVIAKIDNRFGYDQQDADFFVKKLNEVKKYID